jgi:hypothetical protein
MAMLSSLVDNSLAPERLTIYLTGGLGLADKGRGCAGEYLWTL